MGWICGLAVFFALWVIALRRQVRDLNHVVHEQLHRHVSQDERYADLVGQVSDMVFAADLSGRFTAVNAAAEAVTGFTRSEILRASILDLVAASDREQTRLWLQQAVGSHAHHDTTFNSTVARKDGQTIELGGRIRVITREGVPIGFEGVARQILPTDNPDGPLPDAPADRRLVA